MDIVLTGTEKMQEGTGTTARKRQNLGFFAITLLVSVAGALVYRGLAATFVNFLSTGLITASINILLHFAFTYRFRAKTGDEFYDSNAILIVRGLTLVIPFFIFYTLISLLLSGFQIPFKS